MKRTHTRKLDRKPVWIIFVGVLIVVGLCLGVIMPTLIGGAYRQAYPDRIYPGVTVYDVDLGGMTVGEATLVLQAAFPDPRLLPLTLRVGGDHEWARSWADLGFRFDAAGTAQMAYQFGRSGTAAEQRTAALRARLRGHAVSPVMILPDAGQVGAALTALAPEVAVPPTNATLIFYPDGIQPVMGQPGYELDVESTITTLPQRVMISDEGLILDLATRPVPPPVADPADVLAQAQVLLSAPFTLNVDDPLSGYQTSWTVPPGTVSGWLAVQDVVASDPPRLVITADEGAIQAYLDTLDGQLTESLALDSAGSAPLVRAAIEAGQTQAQLAVNHLPHTYIVQPGDTLMSIGRDHGFPEGWIIAENPGMDPHNLYPGQLLTIPSVDVMLPLPLITERRILVDISDQHLYAYENDVLIYDFLCSTGVESAPTIAGVFQILSKEEEAYAPDWELWMPHFMGIYRVGPNSDFTNGIHGSGPGLCQYSLGSPCSSGCIIIGAGEAITLFEWAPLGALVVVQE